MIYKLSFRSLCLFFLVTIGVFSIQAQPAARKSNRVRTYDVQHYTIRVSFDRDRKIVFGDTTVQLKPLKNNFDRLELDATDLQFDSVKIEPGGKDLNFKTDDDKVSLKLDRAYSANELISVRFRYSARPRKGVYFVSKDAENDGIEHPAQIWTQGEPEEAHYWFPSYDFPDDKATSEQFLTVKADETVVANGEPLDETANADGTKTYHFKMSVPHSTYLTSFVVGTYVKISDSYKKTPIAFYTYSGREQIGTQSNQQVKEMMRFFEEITDINYPYNKYEQAIVANFEFGGMENISATTMSDTEMFLIRPDQVEDLVSHELAHSWFGNLVTCKNWGELWLNEGFATYMEAAYREKTYGRNDYLRKIIEDTEEFKTDETTNKKRHALQNRNAKPDKDLFDTTTYQKGGAVLHTLRETVGTEVFWKAVRVYLARHKFQNVETEDLQSAFEEVSKTDLDWFFNQWIYGGGYPKLRVEQEYDPTEKLLKLKIKQTQGDRITPEAFVLPMEVEIATATGAKTKTISIKKREETFTIRLDEKPLRITFDKYLKIPLKSVRILEPKSEHSN